MNSFRLRLPATSANLGPGFDALGLAMELFLEVEAAPAPTFQIVASGRNPDLVGSLERNLILETYRDLLPAGTPLHLKIHNEIPLGMGCGSSAAALLAGVFLANHFGGLEMAGLAILNEACRREGHPDNVAACFYGGMTVSSMDASGVTAATFPPPRGTSGGWRLLLALPAVSLATAEARALLPTHYSRADAVQNVQATALLVSAFALNRPELLLAGTRDALHQPFRMAACPLLASLMPLAGTPGIHCVTLSGAGPSVLLIVDGKLPLEGLKARMCRVAPTTAFEVIETSILHPSSANWPTEP